ncbi:MAG TPA: hypothetical protein VM536_16420 [Chloroflexia bacterium]|nr:hypothetical protein [Chloroflexia bacterium]
MSGTLKFGLTQAAMLAGVGLVTGFVGGWIGLIAADGTQAVAAVLANVFLVLVVLLPGALAFWTWASLDDEDRVNYRSQSESLILLLVASALGSVLGALFFTVVAINIPVIFSGEDNLALRLALIAAIGWQRPLLVVAATVASGVALALWASGRVRAEA